MMCTGFADVIRRLRPMTADEGDAKIARVRLNAAICLGIFMLSCCCTNSIRPGCRRDHSPERRKNSSEICTDVAFIAPLTCANSWFKN